MAKLDWVDVVDQALTRVDKAMDRFRKTPRRRLLDVPLPPPAPDPFSAAAAPPPGAADNGPKGAVEPPVEAPLGDPQLPVQIYGKRSCMWSGRAVKIFQELGIPAKFYDIEVDDNRPFEPRLIRETKQYETPWVYLRGEFIGGYNAIDELHRLGQLELRTLTPDERAAADGPSRSRIRIQVPARPPEDSPEGSRR